MADHIFSMPQKKSGDKFGFYHPFSTNPFLNNRWFFFIFKHYLYSSMVFCFRKKSIEVGLAAQATAHGFELR